jgi:hypothetical protein
MVERLTSGLQGLFPLVVALALRQTAQEEPMSTDVACPPQEMPPSLVQPGLAGHYHLGVARPVPENTLGGTVREQRPHVPGEVVKTITKQVRR